MVEIETEQVPVKSENGGNTFYTASAFEHAFSTMIREKFGAVLGESSIEAEQGHLRRTSQLTAVNERVLIFEYTRLDVLKRDKSMLAKVYIESSSDFEKTDPKDGFSIGSNYDKIWAEMEDEEKVVANLTEKVKDREGAVDTLKALTVPDYFGLAISRWPEMFEFALFEETSGLTDNMRQKGLGRSGTLEGRRPDIYGILVVPSKYEGTGNYSEGKLTVRFPRAYYTTARAYAIAYSVHTLKSAADADAKFEVDQIGWFPLSKPIEHAIFPDLDSPQGIMDKLGKFVEELTKGDRPAYI